ncbi:MAG: D-alanyl-D-alanine carboxypeptidase family protein [Lachnospiraceae bacterium]
MKKRKKGICLLLGMVCLLQINVMPVQAEEAYWPVGPEVAGESAIVMEASTGTILYEKNSHEQLYPASITKIMTSLLAIENSSLDEQVTFSYDSVHKTEGTSISRDVDEVMTMEQCLYAVLIWSANDCAYAVGEHVGGTYDNFINMMNEKAAELGCTNTHFNNPHGLPDENHYTSSHDMALISKEALKNETFRTIVGTKRYTIPCTNKHPDEETYLVNHHKMLFPYKDDKHFLYDYCIGGKTGWTSQAGSTLVTYGEKDGMTLICVVMKEQGSNHYLDTRNLLDYCFENFQLWNVAENETEYSSQNVNSKIFQNEEPFVKMNESGCIVLPKSVAFTDATSKVVDNNTSKNVAGTIQYTYANRVVGGTDIEVTGVTVPKFPFQEQEKQETQKKVVTINIRHILLGILGVIVIAGIGFTIYRFADNFYLMRYKAFSKKQLSFKERKAKKRRRKKRNY